MSRGRLRLSVTGRASSSQARQGRLHSDEAHWQLQTPACLHYTRGGMLPFVTWDAYEQHVQPKAPGLVVPMSTMLVISYDWSQPYTSSGQSLRQFAAMPKDSLVVVTQNDPAVELKTGYNTKTAAAIWAYGGKRMLSVEHYADWAACLRPDVMQGLVDSDLQADDGDKRLQKANQRTVAFAECLSENLIMKDNVPNLWLSLTNLQHRQHALLCAQHLANIPDPAGFVLETLHRMGELNELDLDQCLQNVPQVLVGMYIVWLEFQAMLPPSAVRYAPGAFDPRQLRRLLDCGLDLFDDSFAYLQACKGRLINVTDALSGEYELIDLNDIRQFSMDFSRPVADCECYTCAHYSRAYLNHLLVTEELLAKTALILHNVNAYQRLFTCWRQPSNLL